MSEKGFKPDDYCQCERDKRCSFFKDCWPSGEFGVGLEAAQPTAMRHPLSGPGRQAVVAQDDSLIIVNQDPGDQQC